jgi:NitT/TauT family transport system permease protein
MTSSLTQAEAQTPPFSIASQASLPLSRRLARHRLRIVSVVLLLVALALVWEGVKWIGGNPWRPDANPFGITHDPPFRWKAASDLNLPHLWDIGRAFAQPARRNGPPLSTLLVEAALFTFREAFAGFVAGALLGLVLGTVFARSRLLERGMMPYVVASQTVPILAIAPMVIIWLKAGWVSVAVISAYLTFFPVTINTLRGLRSPEPMALELMRSYAATEWQTLWRVRFPAALPYIFTALKVSATASVVGAIIGELPSGIRTGLGGAILNFNQYYITGPAKLWAAIAVTAVVGIAFFSLVTAAEAIVLRGRLRPTDL